MFPGGRPGVALLLMRAGVGAGLLLEINWQTPGALGSYDLPLRIALACILLVGVLTPAVSMIVVAVVAIDLVLAVQPNVPAALLVGIDAIALSLLGPGAFSYDARRFGRRVLVMTAGDGERPSKKP